VLPILSTAFRGQKGCYSNGQPAVYLTPSITYAALQTYAKVWKRGNKYVQMILQCRVNPSHFSRHPATRVVPGAKVDPNFANNSELIWMVAATQQLQGHTGQVFALDDKIKCCMFCSFKLVLQ